ncbi:MAG: SDR family NAD(P)-dependent oxidoreductase [Actinomycetes bacterium]
MSIALVTGASRGLGLALAHGLAARGWSLVVDARDPVRLEAARAALVTTASAAARPGGLRPGTVEAVPGNVAEPAHRARLIEAAERLGGLHLLVNNASTLGPSPRPALADYPLDALERVVRVNLLAPLALTQLALPLLNGAGGAVVNVTSDAGVEPYEGWGGYGSSKAALDQMTAILGAEHPDLRAYAVDPGDMRTAMHQRAFPGEDISDRAEPETVVPGLLRLLDERPPSGRYRVADFAVEVTAEDEMQGGIPSGRTA